MTDLESAILNHLGPGPNDMTGLVAVHPRGSVYRTLRRLVGRGLVTQAGPSAWALTPGGKAAMDPVPPPVASTPPPCLPLPHLDLAPVPIYRAMLELVMLAVASRSYAMRPGHHPSFVVVGPRLRWKTWLARAACCMTGVDARTAVIPLMNESGRSLTSRRNARGDRVTLRSALDQAVVGLDEWTRATPEVRRLAQVYLHGLIDVPDEDEVLHVKSTAIVLMNPVEGATDLSARTLLDDALIRRSVLLDVAGVVIPAEVLAEGEALIEKMTALGPVEIPPVPDPSWEPRDEVREALTVALDSADRMALIDVTMIAQLVTSATRWLPQADSLRLVLTNYMMVIATLGWTKSDWRERIEDALGEEAVENEPVVAQELPPEDLGIYDYEAKLMALERIARAHGAGEPEVLEQRLALAGAVHAAGLDQAHLPGLVELLRIVRGTDRRPTDRLRVLSALDDLGVDPREALGVLALVASGRELALNAVDLLLVVHGIHDAGLDPADVGPWLADVMHEHDRLDGEVLKAQSELREWRRKVRQAAEDLATLNARIKKLARILERASREPGLAKALRMADSEVGRDVLEAAMKAAGEIAG